MAAYNAGEGRVGRAVENAQAQGLPLRLESLRLPRETLEYVPRVFALRRLIEAPGAYDISLPDSAGAPPLVTVALDRDVDVAVAARLAGMSEARLRQMNPAVRGPLIVAVAHRELLLPVENAFRFTDRVAESSQPLASWSLQRLEHPMSAEEVAQRWRVNAARVREANPLPGGHRYCAGSSLLLPRRGDGTTTAEQVHGSVLATEPAYRRVVVLARKKDNVTRLGKRYGVSAADLALWNPKLSTSSLRKGTSVVLLLPLQRLN